MLRQLRPGGNNIATVDWRLKPGGKYIATGGGRAACYLEIKTTLRNFSSPSMLYTQTIVIKCIFNNNITDLPVSGIKRQER